MDNKLKNVMNEEEMNKLADIIITKLRIVQEEWDQEFHETVEDYMKVGFHEDLRLTDEELLIGELARLQTLMMLYENKEEYEKAAVLLKKVNDIKKKLR